MNAVRKRVARLSGFALVTAGLLIGQLAFAPATNAVELIQDGGFEAATGSPLNSPSWTEADSLFVSPLCSNAECGNGGGTAVPHTGTIFSWFGGSSTAGHTGSLSQAVTIPAGATSLTYWYMNGAVSAPFDATLTVKVDGTTVQTITEAAVAEVAYSQKSANISAFANGASHTISFNYLNGGAGNNNMSVDDVSLDVVADTTAPETTITSSPAGGIAKSLTVPIGFSSNEAPATFSCTLDTGAAAACTSPKSLTVTPGVHTFKVAAKDAANNTDATPATVTFTAYDCPTLTATVAKAAKKLAKAKKALKKAKQSGDAKKIAKAKKKVKKAKKALKAAKAAAAPCGSGQSPVNGPKVDTTRK